jgi:hypothetical protein
MTKKESTGVIGITPEGNYLFEGHAAGHGGPKEYYALTSNINEATLFASLPKQKDYEVIAVPAWSERIVRIGSPNA